MICDLQSNQAKAAKIPFVSKSPLKLYGKHLQSSAVQKQHGAVQFSEGLQLPLNGEESIRNSNRSINMDLAKLSVAFYQLRQVDSLVH